MGMLPDKRWRRSRAGYLSFGENSAVAEYTGKVIAVYHRYDDNETKWIVVPCDEKGVIHSDIELPSDDEIYAQIAFQEQFLVAF